MNPGISGILLFVLSCIVSRSISAARVHKNSVLVFGGNGFIGAETVVKLIELGNRVTIVNRGNWYWDSAIRVKPFVRQIHCDRMLTLNECDEFVEFIVGEGDLVFFDAVLDFSAYHPFAITDAMTLLGKRFGLYIYVSTDSVYDICAAKNHTDPTREDDAIPATNPDDVSQDEDYAERKFECELVLKHSLTIGGPPYIIVRLPDVIGPRDNTKRWWIYQLWIKLDMYVDKHLSIPESLVHTPISLVYVSDVADVLSKLVKAESSLHNQAYNLAFTETVTLPELLAEMQNQLNIENVKIPTNSSNNTIYLYPSVRRGPIDITKAKKYLGWSPIPLKTAIQNTVKFYENAMRDSLFIRPRNEVIQLLTGYLSDDQRGMQIAAGVLHEYGVNLYGKDEL